jgi:small subunit ribosomal protein S20
MANHKQAEKRNRQRIKRRARNLMHLSSMRTYMKRVRRALAEGDLETAKKTLPIAIESIGKANSKGVIHRHAASRYTSRLTVAVNKAMAAATPASA